MGDVAPQQLGGAETMKRIARWQFWVVVIGLVVMNGSLAIKGQSGMPIGENLLIALVYTVIEVALWIAVSVWRGIKR
jgi:hypothetical protein